MTLIIVSILISIGAPSFVDILRNNRLTTQTNALVTSLNLARSEAIKRNVNITMCASNDQATCTGGSWQNGWIVMDNNNQVLRVFEALDGPSTVASAINTLQYTSTGFLNGGVAVSFNLCAGSGEAGRQINITATGRPNNVMPYPTC